MPLRYASLLLLGTFLSLTACESRAPKPPVVPPAGVVQTLRTLYPAADSPRWQLRRDGSFEGRFQLEQLPCKVRIRPDGQWLETETEVARRTLPVPVQDSVEHLLDQPPRTRRVRATSVIRYADGHLEYEVQLREADGKWYRRYYDAQGHTRREERAKHG